MTTPIPLATSATLLSQLDLPGETPTRAAGSLHVLRGEERSPLPLAGVSITARVAARIANVTVFQTFQNPYPDPLEAVYLFPLPGGAAVSRFELVPGGAGALVRVPGLVGGHPAREDDR